MFKIPDVFSFDSINVISFQESKSKPYSSTTELDINSRGRLIRTEAILRRNCTILCAGQRKEYVQFPPVIRIKFPGRSEKGTDTFSLQLNTQFLYEIRISTIFFCYNRKQELTIAIRYFLSFLIQNSFAVDGNL